LILVPIALQGNVVTVWERLVKEVDLVVDLGSDQTSLHNPFNGGYYPVTLSFEAAQEMMVNNPEQFQLSCSTTLLACIILEIVAQTHSTSRKEVQTSLCRHVDAINQLTSRGMRFWDYVRATDVA
jgi:urocanate hydratase